MKLPGGAAAEKGWSANRRPQGFPFASGAVQKPLLTK